MFEAAFNVVKARVNNQGAVLEPEAVVEASTLWRLARPAEPMRPTKQEVNRWVSAAHLLGWYHYARLLASSEASYPDCIQVLLLLGRFVGAHPAQWPVPDMVVLMLGPNASPDMQASIAGEIDFCSPAASLVVIDMLQRSLRRTPRVHPDLVARLALLSDVHLWRFVTTDLEYDLKAAVEYAQQALVVAPDDAQIRRRLAGAQLVQLEKQSREPDERWKFHSIVLSPSADQALAASIDDALRTEVAKRARSQDAASAHLISYRNEGSQRIWMRPSICSNNTLPRIRTASTSWLG